MPVMFQQDARFAMLDVDRRHIRYLANGEELPILVDDHPAAVAFHAHCLDVGARHGMAAQALDRIAIEFGDLHPACFSVARRAFRVYVCNDGRAYNRACGIEGVARS
ncbi:hypothetical protein NKI00_14575 [Mesorhizobium sp. M0847]